MIVGGDQKACVPFAERLQILQGPLYVHCVTDVIEEDVIEPFLSCFNGSSERICIWEGDFIVELRMTPSRYLDDLGRNLKSLADSGTLRLEDCSCSASHV